MKHRQLITPARSNKRKRFVALARVSSREQEREGFSLDVQVEALERYAERNNGEIVKMCRIAETASKADERKTFKELIEYVKEHADEIDGLLFYKVDRAARNLFDYVELERLESEHEVPFISVSQPTDQTPAGRMQRRVLASMASFYTEQQSLDVQEGLSRRVQAGLFVGMAPYGYRNVRRDGRSLVEVDENRAENIRYVFDLYAHHNCTIDTIGERLSREGLKYTDAQPTWPRSKIAKILRDRAYIGEIFYRGQWYPGGHPAIVDRVVWDRVQVLLGAKIYKSHELTYAGELIRCAHCGHPVTGESVIKAQTGKEYVYYRCSRYNSKEHPRVRLKESELDAQILALLARLKQPDAVREWFADMLRLWIQDEQQQSRSSADDIQRELTSLRTQQDRLLNLRLLGEIEADTFGRKNTELRDRVATLTLQLEASHRQRDEYADIAQKVFELSQSLTDRWVGAEYAEKRQILEMLCLNFSLDGATLVPTMRSPFDLLVEGRLVSSSRGDRI